MKFFKIFKIKKKHLFRHRRASGNKRLSTEWCEFGILMDRACGSHLGRRINHREGRALILITKWLKSREKMISNERQPTTQKIRPTEKSEKLEVHARWSEACNLVVREEADCKPTLRPSAWLEVPSTLHLSSVVQNLKVSMLLHPHASPFIHLDSVNYAQQSTFFISHFPTHNSALLFQARKHPKSGLFGTVWRR